MRKLLLLLLLIPQILFAAGETPTKKSTAIGTDDGWGDNFNVFDCDGTNFAYATTGLRLDLIDWNRFEIPQGAMIHGIEVLVTARLTADCSCNTSSVAVSVSGDGATTYSSPTNTNTGNLAAAFTQYTVGNSGERWPQTAGIGGPPSWDWRPEIFNNQSSFTVRLLAQMKAPCVCGTSPTPYVEVDCAIARVHYTVKGIPFVEKLTRSIRK